VLLCLFSAACRAWSRADWGEARQPERSGDSHAIFLQTNRGKLPQAARRANPPRGGG
jgi:hypothetical protein